MATDKPAFSTIEAVMNQLGGADVSRDSLKAALPKFTPEKVNESLATFVSAGRLTKKGDAFTVNKKMKQGRRDRKASGGNSVGSGSARN